MRYLSTGCEGLDSILGGGIPLGLITLLYGEASTGKTSLVLRMSVELGSSERSVIYVDADNSLSPERLVKISEGVGIGEYEDVGIIFFRPWDFDEQKALAENLEQYLKRDSKLVVVDSVTNLYRVALTERNAFTLSKELCRHMANLAELAAKKGLSIICTAQVHSKPGINDAIPVARRVLTYWAGITLKIELMKDRRFRSLTVERFPNTEIEKKSIKLRFKDDGLLCC